MAAVGVLLPLGVIRFSAFKPRRGGRVSLLKKEVFQRDRPEVELGRKLAAETRASQSTRKG